ncbi:MAG: MG2 domain-containing protein [Bacteroidaceae bacterium]|nr:MG2 domain-containing protein [Bacteroidaceae bacterium]
MKQFCTLLLALSMSLLPFLDLHAQDYYSAHWTAVSKALRNDLPATALEHIAQIRQRALKEGNMPQLCRALFQTLQCQTEISPDSLATCRDAIHHAMLQEKRPEQKAVYQHVLGIAEGSDSLLRASLSDLPMLAKAKATDYLPLIEKGKDSGWMYGDNLLSLFLNVAWGGEWEDIIQKARKIFDESGKTEASLLLLEKLDLDSPTLYNTWRKAMDENPSIRRCTPIAEYLQRTEQPTLQLSMLGNHFVRPGQPITFVATSHNLAEATLQLDGHTYTFHFADTPPYEERTDTLTCTIDKPGIYKAVISARGTKEPQTWMVHVSSVKPIIFGLPDGRSRITLVDASTGRTLPEARIEERTDKGIVVATYRADKSGDIYINKEALNKARYDHRFYPIAGKDSYHPAMNKWDFTSGSWHSYTMPYQQHTKAFTDRQVYRPGQQVQVGLISYSRSEDAYHTLAKDSLTITLFSTNHEKIETLTAQTDELGTASVTFTLPDKCTPGGFSVQVTEKDTDHYRTLTTFRVEEYKRPTFEITTDTFNEHFSPGDTAVIRGLVKTYSGVPLAEARVTTDEGDSTYTDTEGRFILPIRVEAHTPWRYWGQTVKIAVTSPIGETQHTTVRIPIKGTRPYINPAEETDKRPRSKQPFWHEEKTSRDGSETHISLGSCHSPVLLRLDLLSDNRLLWSKNIEFTDSFDYTLKYDKAWGDGAVLHLAFVANDTLHTTSIEAVKPMPDKRLILRWSTFRSLLQPGQDETWTLRVTRPDGSPANASIMARLYDASLDAFGRGDWSFQTPFDRNLPSASYRTPFWDFHPLFLASEWKDLPALKLTAWRSGLFSYYNGHRYMRKGMVMNAPMASPMRAKASAAEGVEEMATYDMVAGPLEGVIGGLTGEMPTPAFRENFSETAFFLPSLRCDAEGHAVISFRLSDCLTTWHFTAFAHDAEMNFGFLNDTIVAQKLLMAEIAAPRFLREGDTTDIPVTVTNLSDKTQECTLSFWADGTEVQQLLTLAPAERRMVTYPYSAGRTEATFRVWLRSPEWSDGEVRRIPILSDRVKVTRSVPYSLTRPGSRTIDLSPLWRELPEGAEATLTLEQTSNPAWQVVESLKPVLGERAESATEWMLQLYAARIASYLKPYIGEAETDSILNSTELGALAQQALAQLQDRQSPSGGWSWFRGMNCSPWVTTSVATSLARIEVLTGSLASAERQMLERAQKYLAHEIAKSVADMKDYEKKYKTKLALGEFHYEYLYLCALTSTPKNSDIAYLIGKAVKDKHSLTMYGKAGAAVALAYYNESNTAHMHLKSLLEHTVYSDEMGRYFDTARAVSGWRDYKIPTQTFAIEALDKIMPKSTDKTAEMRLWLLQSKRTQKWQTSYASADAAYAIIKGQTNTLQPGVAGRAYTREVYTDAAHIGMPSLTVENAEKGLVRRAAGAEFERPIAEVRPSGSGISLKRRLEMPKVLHPGDVVKVHYTLKADRNMDYVHIESSRAACMEPTAALSGYDWRTGAYRSVHDDRSDYFFEHLSKGTHEFTEEFRVDRTGSFMLGIATAECVYAPEYRGGTGNTTLCVTEM